MNTILGLRHAQSPGYLRIFVRQAHANNRKPKQPTTGFQGPQDHGRKIYVFSHRRTDQIIYTFREKLDGFHDLKQLPFNGKKTKPAKLRKDYWSPMATIEFADDQGPVGRSVFQKLRELKHLHEVAWPDEFRHKRPEEYTKADEKAVKRARESGRDYHPIRSKRERGWALNAQKANAIADIAAILAGQGRGNKMVKAQQEEGADSLHQVTVSWFNSGDKKYAEAWSENVTHEIFEDSPYQSLEREFPDASESSESKTVESQPNPA